MGHNDSDERYDTLLAATALLYANGQSTQMTQTAVERLNRGLGLDAVVVPSWSMLTLTAAGSRATVLTAAVSPTAINMRRVATMMGVVDRAQDGPLELENVVNGIAEAEAQSVSNTMAFVLACATGAAALSVIYGATQPLAILLVALAAAVGGLLRRGSGAVGAGPLVQVFAAALIAGAVGAAANHLHLGASAAVVAICPAMVLVPGPHILNGALDLLDLRVTLGLARLAYGLLLLTSISGGLILGLHTGGQTLAVTAPSSSAPFIVDVLAAGVAAASYPVYFSMPWRMIGWPVAAGMLAHAAHWCALHLGANLAFAAFVSCLLVGVLLVPISHRMRIPFAGIGFASVVALVPGVLVFRTLAGFVEFAGHPSAQLFTSAAADLIVATVIVTGMALGLALPMHVYADRLARLPLRRGAYAQAMSVKVDLDRLADELANYTFAYLVTVGDDFHVHTVAVEPVFADGRFDVGPVGGTTSRNLASHDSATLVWPPGEPGGYTLIVDGRGESQYLVPDRAVLHRKAAPGVATKPGCKDDCHPLEKS